MGIYSFFKNKINMKRTNYQKELYRGTIKQIMKVRGLRAISLENYNKWLGKKNQTGVHSLKLDIQDGYINIYGYKPNGRCGIAINDASAELYEGVYNEVNEILNKENEIPTKVRRNILVRLSR